MSNLVPLRTKDISPTMVVQSLQEDVEQMEDIFVVSITANGPVVYASGNLMLLSFAALVLQDIAMKQLNDEISGTDDETAG